MPRGSTPTPTASATNDTDDRPVSNHDPSDNPWVRPQMSSTTPDPDTADRDSSRPATKGFEDEDDEEEAPPGAEAEPAGQPPREAPEAPVSAPVLVPEAPAPVSAPAPVLGLVSRVSVALTAPPR